MKSFFIHNHLENNKVKTRLHEKEISEFVKEIIVEKNDGPASTQEKLSLKFPSLEFDYVGSANILYKAKQEVFGCPDRDAQNLLELCEAAKKEFPNFYYNFKLKEPEKILSSIFLATPAMRTQYQKFKNLLILDTTFGTNRFKLPFMIGALVNEMGRTIILLLLL